MLDKEKKNVHRTQKLCSNVFKENQTDGVDCQPPYVREVTLISFKKHTKSYCLDILICLKFICKKDYKSFDFQICETSYVDQR